jgi:hypothetical protein
VRKAAYLAYSTVFGFVFVAMISSICSGSYTPLSRAAMTQVRGSGFPCQIKGNVAFCDTNNGSACDQQNSNGTFNCAGQDCGVSCSSQAYYNINDYGSYWKQLSINVDCGMMTVASTCSADPVSGWCDCIDGVEESTPCSAQGKGKDPDDKCG